MSNRIKVKSAFIFCCTCLLHLVPGVVVASSVEADDSARSVPVNQLSLPKSYRSYFPALQQAANLASQVDRCKRFLQGGLQVDRSTLTRPVFSVLCRDEQGRSFAMLIDGISLRLLDETRPEGSVSFNELQHEARREASEEIH